MILAVSNVSAPLAHISVFIRADINRVSISTEVAYQVVGMRLVRTKGRRRAAVSVAKKLAVQLHRMWTDNTESRPEKVEGQI